LRVNISKQSTWFLVLMAAVGVCVFGIELFLQPREYTDRIVLGQNDFMQLYAGARLMGSSAMYSTSANERIQREAVGVRSDSMLHHSRLPFYSCFLRPLAFLPYRTAYYIFQAISVVCFLLFLGMFVPGCRELAAFASLSIPFFANLQNGQDTTIVLMFAGLSIFLARKNLEFWSGFALSFCAIKFHLFALIPLIVLIQRRWRIFFGALSSGSILIGLSFLCGGADWPQAYIAAMGDSKLHPHPDYMPNLHTISAVLSGPAGLGLEATLSLVVVAAVVYLSLKVPDYELTFAFALIGSLLVSVHSYPQDCIVLLLPLAIILKKPFSKPAAQLTELVSSPIPYFFLLAGVPFNLAMPALLMGILTAAVRQARA
jgi:hypothetical protein